MSRFSADWLALREPYDIRARNPDILSEVAAALAHLPSVTIVDLACGTGSTRRAIAARMPRPQHWRLVDNDMGLLARAMAGPQIEGNAPRAELVDLVRDLESALDGAPDLVTTSALLDLVSDSWLERLVVECAARYLPFYAALTFTGEIEFDPADPLDRDVVDAFNHHQRGDKGFGPALGGAACDALIAHCHKVGYEVSAGPSDWAIAPGERDFQRANLEGLVSAAMEAGGVPASELEAWANRRRRLIDAGALRLRVSHRDIFARPIGIR